MPAPQHHRTGSFGHEPRPRSASRGMNVYAGNTGAGNEREASASTSRRHRERDRDHRRSASAGMEEGEQGMLRADVYTPTGYERERKNSNMSRASHTSYTSYASHASHISQTQASGRESRPHSRSTSADPSGSARNRVPTPDPKPGGLKGILRKPKPVEERQRRPSESNAWSSQRMETPPASPTLVRLPSRPRLRPVKSRATRGKPPSNRLLRSETSLSRPSTRESQTLCLCIALCRCT